MPFEIFISYRRDDAAVEAAWLYNLLNTFFGKDSTFFDKHEIASGDRWTDVLKNRVEQASVVLVLIGPGWLKAQDKISYQRRLDMEQDWVRKEIAHALSSAGNMDGKKIIPVLINGVSVPSASAALPADIAPVAERQLVYFKTDKYLEFAKYLYDALIPPLTSVADFDYDKVHSPYDLLNYPLPADLPRPAQPYTGLDYFKRDQARIFFGRSASLLELVKKLESHSTRIVRLYGQSGVGKSSLLHAGLFPRMEKTYNIRYHRRDKSIGLAAGLEQEIETLRSDDADKRPFLLIVDQAEEMFTNPNNRLPKEIGDFITALKQAHTDWPAARFILSYRVERDSDFRKMLDEVQLDSNEYYLQRLEQGDIVDAIRGVTRDAELNEKYHLELETGLPEKIADDMLGDGQSQVAPMLQLLLRKMWDAVEKNPPPQRVFDKALYARFRQDSMFGMLLTQLAELEKTNPEVVQKGLALDVLQFFTTESGTSGVRTDQELQEAYPQRPDILDLKETFKRLYLLTDGPAAQSTRLAHDALAQAVIRQYVLSEAPGQKATKFLQNALTTQILLDKQEYLTVSAGMNWRRQLTTAESEFLEESLLQHYKAIVRKLLSNNMVEESFQLLQHVFDRKEYLSSNTDLILLSAQYARFRNDFSEGLISYDNSIIEKNKIKSGITDLLDTLEEFEVEKILVFAEIEPTYNENSNFEAALFWKKIIEKIRFEKNVTETIIENLIEERASLITIEDTITLIWRYNDIWVRKQNLLLSQEDFLLYKNIIQNAAMEMAKVYLGDPESNYENKWAHDFENLTQAINLPVDLDAIPSMLKNGQAKEVIAMLIRYDSNSSMGLTDSMIIPIQARFIDCFIKFEKGIIRKSEFNIEKAKINYALLNIFSQLKSAS